MRSMARLFRCWKIWALVLTAISVPCVPVWAAENGVVANVHSEVSSATEADSAVPCTPRNGDEWWLVDTRSLPDCATGGAPSLAVFKYVNNGSWQPSSVTDLAAGQTEKSLTCLYAHGNRMMPSDAVARGTHVYRALVDHAPPGPGVRFVIFSWPSEKAQGQLRDVRIKADRTEADGYYLGWLLAQFPNRGHLSLLGYSFGARIVTGALHLRAGGEMNGLTVSRVAAGDPGPVRVSLLAAAVHNDWILPGHYHGQCLAHVDHMFLGLNSCDPALQRYRLLDKCSKPEALGYTGLVGANLLGETAQRIVQLDACCSNGRTHDELPYFCSPNVLAELQRHLLWQATASR